MIKTDSLPLFSQSVATGETHAHAHTHAHTQLNKCIMTRRSAIYYEQDLQAQIMYVQTKSSNNSVALMFICGSH